MQHPVSSGGATWHPLRTRADRCFVNLLTFVVML